jgi:hypothetical protein
MRLQWGNYEQMELTDYLRETFGCAEDAKETEIKKKDNRNKPCAQKPSDEEIAFFDPACEKLFKLLCLISEDVGFSWPTGMLYGTLLQILIDARDEDNDEGLKNSIYRIRRSKELWKRIQTNRKEIEEILSEYLKDKVEK